MWFHILETVDKEDTNNTSLMRGAKKKKKEVTAAEFVSEVKATEALNAGAV